MNMKKVLIGILIFCVLLSSVGCSLGNDFSKFQGTWVYEGDIYKNYIEIKGDFAYERIVSNAVDDQWPLGVGLIKEGNNFYIVYSDGVKDEICVSNDGKELIFNGKTYEKQ